MLAVAGRVEYLSDVCKKSLRRLARQELPVTTDENTLRISKSDFKPEHV
jgi:hypothetical protein